MISFLAATNKTKERVITRRSVFRTDSGTVSFWFYQEFETTGLNLKWYESMLGKARTGTTCSGFISRNFVA